MILGSREGIHTGRLLLVLFDSLRRSRSVPLTNVVTYCVFEKVLQHLLKIFMSSSEQLADRFYVRARQPSHKFAKTVRKNGKEKRDEYELITHKHTVYASYTSPISFVKYELNAKLTDVCFEYQGEFLNRKDGKTGASGMVKATIVRRS